MLRCEGSRELKRATKLIKQDTRYTLSMSSFPTSIYVYPATSVTGSLNGELISVGDSVHFSTGPNEVNFIVTASCWLVY